MNLSKHIAVLVPLQHPCNRRKVEGAQVRFAEVHYLPLTVAVDRATVSETRAA